MTVLRKLIYVSVFLIWADTFPPIAYLFQYLYISGREIYPTDILFGILFFWTVANLSLVEKYVRKNDLYQRLIISFMLFGAIPLICGWFEGNGNLFANMRLFSWGLLAIVGPLAFQSLKQFYKLLYFYLFLHAIRVIYYFIYKLFVTGNLVEKIMLYDSRDILACAILVTALALFDKNKTDYSKFLKNFIFPLSVLVILLNMKRAYYLGYFLALLVFVVVGIKRGKFIKKSVTKYILYAGIIMLVVTAYRSNEIFTHLQERFDLIVNYERDPSAMSRVIGWGIILERIKKRPLLGYGSGAYGGVVALGHEQNPHNVYLEIAFWGGFSTLLFFLLVQVIIIRHGFKDSMRAPPRIRVLLIGGSTMMTGIMVSSIFGLMSGSQYFTYWFYTVLALIPLRLMKLHNNIDLKPGKMRNSASRQVNANDK